jgi:hypothetical protein
MAETPTKRLTDAEQEVHKEYAQALRNRGFCTLDDASSNQTQLFNCINGKTLPVSFLTNDFPRWRRENEKQCEEFRAGFVLAFLEHVVGSKFLPKPVRLIEEQDTGCTFVNTYRAYKPGSDDAEVSPLFLDFFARLMPDEQEHGIVMQWLAHIFQRPEQRPSWHLMLTSDTGTGKGFLVENILHPLLRHTSVVSDYSQVMGRFSGVLANNLLVLIDDAKAKTEATQTQLKSLLSEERAYVEKKHGDAGMVDTYTRFILASNEHRPLWLDASERRWYVTARLVHRHDRTETAAFIQKLADWLAEPGSLDRVYNWFMAYDLTGFNPKCVPDSAGLAAMVAMSRSPCADFLEGYVAEHPVFRYSDMVDALRAEGLTKPGDREMVHLLREVGYDKTQPRIEGKLVRLCHPVGMSLDAIRAAYREPETAF